jgi:hypothetical protein
MTKNAAWEHDKLARIIWTGSLLKITDAQGRSTREEYGTKESKCSRGVSRKNKNRVLIKWWLVTLHAEHSSLCCI